MNREILAPSCFVEKDCLMPWPWRCNWCWFDLHNIQAFFFNFPFVCLCVWSLVLILLVLYIVVIIESLVSLELASNWNWKLLIVFAETEVTSLVSVEIKSVFWTLKIIWSLSFRTLPDNVFLHSSLALTIWEIRIENAFVKNKTERIGFHYHWQVCWNLLHNIVV